MIMSSFQRWSRAVVTGCLLAVAGTAQSACGHGGDSGRDAGADTEDAGNSVDAADAPGTGDPGCERPSCATTEFRVCGVLDGADIDEHLVVAGQRLVNEPGDEGCYLNLYFEGGGRLRLEWADTLLPDESCDASGSVNLAAQGGINVGDCDDDGPSSRITMLADGVEFELHELRQAPYCTGAPVAGELSGCARFE